MLEASSFDFRNRHPQQLVIKLAKHYGIERHSDLARTAYQVSLDIYRTFAPLKQTTAALAFACLELAGRLLNYHNEAIQSGNDYETWQISRAMVMGMSRLPIFYKISNISRDPARPPRALYPLQKQYNRGPQFPRRNIPRSPYPPEPRNGRQTSSPLHGMERPQQETHHHKRGCLQSIISNLKRYNKTHPQRIPQDSISFNTRPHKRHQHTRKNRRARPRRHRQVHAEPRAGTRGESDRG